MQSWRKVASLFAKDKMSLDTIFSNHDNNNGSISMDCSDAKVVQYLITKQTLPNSPVVMAARQDLQYKWWNMLKRNIRPDRRSAKHFPPCMYIPSRSDRVATDSIALFITVFSSYNFRVAAAGSGRELLPPDFDRKFRQIRRINYRNLVIPRKKLLFSKINKLEGYLVSSCFWNQKYLSDAVVSCLLEKPKDS